MTHPAPAPSQHLLTRSDLAKLGISAGSILAWLADRLLEPVGSLPGADGEKDAVFAVPDRDHRLHLAGKLAAIGKEEIVFSPARVWSLMRLAMKPANGSVPTDAPALDVTSEMLGNDVEAFVEMTREEARVDAKEFAAPAPDAGGKPKANDRAEGLDAGDLIGALDTWDTKAAAAPTAFEGGAPVAAAAEPAVAQAMTRVESFLGELRTTLVELANRPQAQPVDVQPLVAAMQSGFVHSAERATATNSALASLTDAVRTALDHEPANHGDGARPAAFVVPRSDRSTIVLFAIGFLLLCWTAIFWFKTGNPRLAFGTLVGANLVGCCLVAGRRRG